MYHMGGIVLMMETSTRVAGVHRASMTIIMRRATYVPLSHKNLNVSISGSTSVSLSLSCWYHDG